ncbi:MAG: YbjN domain-containing protein [Myxococcota bacterium]|nr:YbjN domain-containing protein [Myxococcota bacterium]MDW8362350.1 hypothetical protein [Myxococcales bacterium]
MRTREDVEAYLLRSGRPYEEVGEETWLVRDPATGENVVVRLSGPLVVVRVKVMPLSALKRRAEALEKLLELNASELVHVSYGVAGDAVVLTATLRLETLDYEELQSVLDEMSLAVTQHHATLAAFRDA